MSDTPGGGAVAHVTITANSVEAIEDLARRAFAGFFDVPTDQIRMGRVEAEAEEVIADLAGRTIRVAGWTARVAGWVARL